MQITVYCNPNHEVLETGAPIVRNGGSMEAMTAFKIGCDKKGIGAMFRNPGPFHPGCIEKCDLIVIHGLRAAKRIKEAYAKYGVPSLVFDASVYAREQGYVSVRFGGPGWLPATIGIERNDRAVHMGLVVVDQKQSAGGRRASGTTKEASSTTKKTKSFPVLLLGQHNGDVQHGFKNFWGDWALHMAKSLLTKTDCEVIYRPHPWTMKADADFNIKISNVLFQSPLEVSLEKAVQEVRAVICYNSSAAYEAFRYRTPVFCHSSAAYASASNSINDLALLASGKFKRPTPKEAQELLNRAAYAQWTADEFVDEDGIFWSFLAAEFEEYKKTIESPASSEMRALLNRVRELEEENEQLRTGVAPI